jgi:CubicO group peptidase (beta-lactamase class C family)
LLNHSSGIKGYKSKESGTKKEYANLTEAMKVFMNRDIIGKHGIEENYTTYGYVVLGVLIERVSNQTYESYMEENIWNKIEMNNTGVEHFEVAYDNKSKLYHRNRRGKIKEAKKANNLSNRIPGGGFYSTVDDLLKFGQAVIDFALISKETTALMLEFQNTKYDGNPYAFGWHLYGRSTSRASVVGHGGEQTGVSAQLMVAPQRNMVIVVMSNTFGSYNEVRGTSIQLVETAVKLDNIKRANAE